MAEGKRPPDEVFTLRLWHEGDAQTGQWRAIVTHVRSGERRFFSNYGDLCTFLDRWKERPGGVRPGP